MKEQAEPQGAQQVSLRYTRFVQNEHLDGQTEQEAYEIHDARMSEKPHARYVSYLEPSDDASTAPSRMTMAIALDKVTVIRHGAVRWTHVFQAGRRETSNLYVAGLTLPVQTETKRLCITSTSTGGSVELQYVMNLGEGNQQVTLTMEYELTPESQVHP